MLCFFGTNLIDRMSSFRLVCTALYNDGDGERKYLPQFFKFIVANPLSVRTKVLTSFFFFNQLTEFELKY